MLSTIGLPGLLLIAVVVLVLFGRGRVSTLMGEVGQGIRSFRANLNADDANDTQITDATTSAGTPTSAPKA